MPFFKNLDEFSDITDVTWNDRKRLGPMDNVSQSIMRGESPFTSVEKEIMAAFVSGLNACQFCYGTHKAVAKNFGVTEELIESLIEDVDTAAIDEKLKPVFHYLRKLTLTPSKVIQADADKVFDAGWSEQALYDAILICCLFNFYNRLLDGHGIKGSKQIYQFGGNHLSKSGYGVPWFIGLIKNMIRKNKVEKLKSMEPIS